MTIEALADLEADAALPLPIALDLFAGTGWGVACRRLGIQEYGGFRSEARPAPNGSQQTRVIVAAHSVAEVLRLTGMTRSEWNWSGGETGNDDEMATALAEPGVVFWTELGDSVSYGPSNWRRAPKIVVDK